MDLPFSPSGPAAALGLAGWLPVLMLVVALLMFGVELFVLPGFGVAGVTGLVTLVAAAVMVALGASVAPVDIAIALTAVISSVTLIGVGIWAFGSRLGAGHPLFGGRLRREEGYIAALPRPELEGTDGVALTDLRPAGTADFAGERMDVVSEAGWITAGTPVRILRSEGYRHVVRALPLPPPAEEPAAPPPAPPETAGQEP
ncbi:MAG TPA: NfeD family protein [Longimicrobium sp.]|nr:NfeD family protein [Longimicrobium sp.]